MSIEPHHDTTEGAAEPVRQDLTEGGERPTGEQASADDLHDAGDARGLHERLTAAVRATVAAVAPVAGSGQEPAAAPPAEEGKAQEGEAQEGEVQATDAEAAEQEPHEAPVRLPPPPLPVPRSSRPRRFGALVLELVLITVTMFVGWFVWSLRTWARGQTPAKSLLSMRCVRIETARVAGWRTMALRELVGKELLGAVTVGITVVFSAVRILGPTRQGLWDRIAGTTVVDDPDGRTL